MSISENKLRVSLSLSSLLSFTLSLFLGILKVRNEDKVLSVTGKGGKVLAAAGSVLVKHHEPKSLSMVSV